MKIIKQHLFCLLFLSSLSYAQVRVPEPVGPIPTENQMAWQEMEFYGFIHFNMNTFSNVEWGYGDTPAKLFNPTELDARQWARIAKEAGMKGLILTDKHHDGFCLWPSAYTNYSVKNAAWKDGQGDVVKELAEACKEYGLKMGIYLSPWDRNNPYYGKEAYIDIFRKQLTELLSNYGDIFEVWFDGANGGDGYYGGANEERRVDKRTYYDWENTYAIIRELQPNAVIFSDAGPDVRWVGNEHGYAYETTWSTLMRDSVYGGMPEYAKQYAQGQEDGSHWVPAEADVSIRPGWYYHESEDDKVKSLASLLDIYYKSVGQNSTYLLNLPVDKRGLVHENDERQLQKLAQQLQADFALNLALNLKTETSNTRGGSDIYAGSNAVDNNPNSYWATDDLITSASLTIDFKKPTEFNRVLIQEYIKLGQRVKKFSLEAEINDEWIDLGTHTTIGYKRILRFDNKTATKIRFNILNAKACPLISAIEIYKAPTIVDEPVISRTKEGMVSFNNPEDGVEVFYTTDGSEPSTASKKYQKPFSIDEPTMIKAFTFEPRSKRKSDLVNMHFEISKKLWKVISPTGSEKNILAIDDNKWTDFQLDDKQEIVIDLGKNQTLTGFSYTPTQRRWATGVITHYELYGSADSTTWKKLSSGEFSNIIANPVQQKIWFNEPGTFQFIKFIGTKIMNDAKPMIAEIGVLTRPSKLTLKN